MMSSTKPKTYHYYVFFALLTFLFVSCERDTFNETNDERVAPLITLSTASDEAEGYEGQTVNGTVSLEAQAGIASIQVTRDGQPLETIQGVSGQVARDYAIQYIIPVGASVGSNVVYNIVLEDRQGRRVEQNFTIRIINVPPIPDFEFEDVVVGGNLYKLINLDINRDVTLTNDHEYLLRGKVAVIQGASLTIEEGTKIYAEGGAALTISTSAKIIAEGTASEPVLFTSLAARNNAGASGDWIGLFIHGLAPVVRTNTIVTGTDNGVGREYGGDNAADDSGILKYVEISYAGGALRGTGGSNDQEINAALNLNGVGNGTQIEYIFVNHAGLSRTGVLAAGGSVRLKHVVVNNPNGRALVYKDGYIGLIQFLGINYTSNPTNAFTAIDGFGETAQGPVLSNISIQGGANSNTRGVRIRTAPVSIYNSWINRTGNPGLRTDETVNVVFSNSRVWGNGSGSQNFHSSSSAYNSSASPHFNSTNPVSIVDGYKGIAIDNAMNPMTLDPWFSPANYVGAVDPANDWTAGWINIP